MDFHRLCDAVLYALVNYIAYIPLVVYPFKNKFRYSKRISFLVLVLISAGFVFLSIATVMGMPSFLIPLISVPVAAGALYWGIDERLGKTLVTLLIEYNNASFVNVMAKNIEILIFPHRPHVLYCMTHSLFILIGVVVVYVIDLIYSENVYNEIINMPGNTRAWKYLWTTPMSYYFVWMIYTSFNQNYINGTMEKPGVLLLLILFSVCSFVAYYIIIKMVYFEGEKYRLEYRDTLNQLQYRRMHDHIEDAKRSRHDLRHHYLVISAMANKDDSEGIRNYMKQFSKKYESGETIIYCRNYGVNALLTYYVQQAKAADIMVEIDCQIPETIGFSDRDLTIVFGNLLENALNACKKITGRKPKITVSCRYEGKEMILKIKNTANQKPRQDSRGRYLSSSHAGYGIGIESVKDVVERYHGFFKTVYQDESFEVSVWMRENSQSKRKEKGNDDDAKENAAEAGQ